ncbi:ABC transporter ATP-binding protein [Halogeometricum borinquense]|uniref:Molybdate/tungstate import ATP-binding protein WtpC n=1 Tax=Halogeometricum borinquense TaxID=60847 RepID=A0A6C0UIX2_9EURY|nr:ABC transporter ATP-binding protein [Halogeometricum borinquense]QIB75466.1 ABC transporter ATP-binding protein [Halogeometricum borinquense]
MTGTDSPSTALISLENVGKRYESTTGSETDALTNISFTVASGEFVTVVGPSGCGKTTLIRLVGGLESPTSGAVRVDGRPVSGPSPNRAMVFQEHRLFPWLTVRENIAFGLVEAGVPERTRTERTDELLELVGLVEYSDMYPTALSGGMKQRVGLARALAVDPDILLMDEPFGSVDAQTRRTLQGELLDIWRETGKTVLFVTHDVEEAVRLGDRLLVMQNNPGRIRNSLDVDIARPRTGHREELAALETRVLDLLNKPGSRSV